VVVIRPPESSRFEDPMRAGPGNTAEEAGLSGAILNEATCGDDQQSTMREFEVTVLTTRSGTTVVVVAASEREAALDAVRKELASGDCTAPPEQAPTMSRPRSG
jgi:hypothetical protein